MSDFIGMRPSERRREERRDWWVFGLLCLGSLIVVFGIGELAGVLIDPRFTPRQELEQPAPPPIARVFPPAAGRRAGTLVQGTAREVQGLLTIERQETIAGAVLFLKGAID